MCVDSDILIEFDTKFTSLGGGGIHKEYSNTITQCHEEQAKKKRKTFY